MKEICDQERISYCISKAVEEDAKALEVGVSTRCNQIVAANMTTKGFKRLTIAHFPIFERGHYSHRIDWLHHDHCPLPANDVRRCCRRSHFSFALYPSLIFPFARIFFTKSIFNNFLFVSLVCSDRTRRMSSARKAERDNQFQCNWLQEITVPRRRWWREREREKHPTAHLMNIHVTNWLTPAVTELAFSHVNLKKIVMKPSIVNSAFMLCASCCPTVSKRTHKCIMQSK